DSRLRGPLESNQMYLSCVCGLDSRQVPCPVADLGFAGRKFVRCGRLPFMKAVRFDFADATFPASLAEVDEPTLPTGDWARVAVNLGGICGSDLHLFLPVLEGSPILAGIAEFPFELGHEIAGTVVEVGDDCPVAVGTRVAIDPIIPCLARGIDPPCVNCAKG